MPIPWRRESKTCNCCCLPKKSRSPAVVPNRWSTTGSAHVPHNRASPAGASAKTTVAVPCNGNDLVFKRPPSEKKCCACQGWRQVTQEKSLALHAECSLFALAFQESCTKSSLFTTGLAQWVVT